MTSLRELSEKFTKTAEEIPDSHIVDGVAVCNICNAPRQCKIKWLGAEKLVECMCECGKKDYAAQWAAFRKDEEQANINHNRSIGLMTGSANYTFENATIDKENEKIISLCKSYAEFFDQMAEKNIGLKLWGGTGTGKSFLANCIFNAVIDKGYRAYYATAGHIVNEIQKLREKNEYIDDICDYDLLIIDDLGAERDTETSAQYIQDVIDRRITRNKPLIITTNINDLEASTLKEKRLYSRLEGMMQSLKCVGSDRRCAQHLDKSNEFKRIIIEGMRKKENEKNM